MFSIVVHVPLSAEDRGSVVRLDSAVQFHSPGLRLLQFLDQSSFVQLAARRSFPFPSANWPASGQHQASQSRHVLSSFSLFGGSDMRVSKRGGSPRTHVLSEQIDGCSFAPRTRFWSKSLELCKVAPLSCLPIHRIAQRIFDHVLPCRKTTLQFVREAFPTH